MAKKEKDKVEKKPSKEKKPKKEKSPLEQDPTFIKTTIMLAACAVIAILVGGAANLWNAQQTIIASEKTARESNLEVYTKLVNTEILLLQKQINAAADLIESTPSVFDLDETAMETIDKILSDSLPQALATQVFLHSRYDLDKESYPPVNFATQKQLLDSESAEIVLPEFYKHPKGDYFSLVRTIRNPESGELTFSILVSYSDSYVIENFPSTAPEHMQVSLIQTFPDRSEEAIYSVGDKSVTGNNKHKNETIHPKWKVQYHSDQQQQQFSKTAISIAISLSISLILMSGAIWFGMRNLRNGLSSDASLILEFIRSGNTKQINSGMFKMGILRELYSQIKKIEKPKSAGNKSKNRAATDKDFDIEIASDDNDLFGAEHEVSDERTQAPSEAINPSIFRAYDIRGVVDETLSANVVKQIGQAIGTMAQKQGENTIIIARDGRLSGPELSEALCQGILSSGANVIDIGMVPTPLLYFACHRLESKSGVMLTGSHNPSNHNGLKMVINGVTLSEDSIQELRESIEKGELSSGQGELSHEDVMPAYIDTVENDVILAQPLDIVVDCGNGVAGVMAEKLFEEIGCNVTPLYTEVDGNFPNHHPDPSQPKNLEDLIAKVKETGAHLGFAFDGDGDRVGVVTNEGKIIWPDRLMMLFSKDILLRNPGADIIFDIKCSNLLADTIRKQGGRPLMWKTGHSLIKAKLKETGAQLAGEMSGHIFFNDRWYGFDDGLYSAARLLEILSTDSKTVDEVFAEYPEMVSTPEINIPVDDESKFDILSILVSLGEFGDGNKTDIDGVRVDYKDGWGLVRASNTTANLVTRFEAKSEERLEEIKAIFKQQILKVQSDLDIPF